MAMQQAVIIIGGGLIGSALAIALAEAGIDSALVEREERQFHTDPRLDGRTSAIALGSYRILKRIGVWEKIAEAEAITDIRVLEGNSPLHVHYNASEIGDEPFGYIVRNTVLREALLQRLEELPAIRRVHGAASGIRAGSGSIEVEVGEEMLHGQLVIACDGKQSPTRKLAGIGHRVHRYGQTAIVCIVDHSEPHRGLALERFLPDGPFAVLPLPGKQSGIVWTVREEDSQALTGMDDAMMIAALQVRMGEYWGDVTKVSPRLAYPLTLTRAERFTAPRLALAGDSAHAIHPIAGQGVNLGYRDVAILAEMLVEQARLGLDLGAENLLRRYADARAVDTLSMTAVTDGINRLFSNHRPGMKLARNLGLGAVERIAPLKRRFMNRAMGMQGDLPKLMRGEKL